MMMMTILLCTGTVLQPCDLAIDCRFHFVDERSNEALLSSQLQQLSYHNHDTHIEDLVVLGLHMFTMNQIRNLESCSCLG
jgi:hypothetical protein